ncbi:MAG: NYN domain-containing protein [Propionibacteriaceae bacterium]|nr:NYN domain-containing protein [Propionibacteriaceae bacterium]
MRSQSALFVDAGYLIAAAATRLTGSSFRRSVSVNYERLVAELIALVEDGSGLPLLRIYWYDAGRNGQADEDQQKVATLPKVKLRLGRIGVEGEQKGVDLRLGLDMVGQSRNRVVDTIYLLSGDDDLTQAVEEAQAQGVQVVVLAVPTAAGGIHGVNRHLIQEADGVEVLPASLLDAVITRAMTPVAAPTPLVVPGPRSTRMPSPSDLAKRAAQRDATPPITAYSGGAGVRPYIAPDYQRDPEEVEKTITEVVRRAYEAWLRTATAEQKEDLLAAKPSIPHDLDRALLIDLSDAFGGDYLSDRMRVQLRSGFWGAVEATLPENA